MKQLNYIKYNEIVQCPINGSITTTLIVSNQIMGI